MSLGRLTNEGTRVNSINPFHTVKRQIEEDLDQHTAFLTEIAASNIMALCLEDLSFCQSILLEGPSGSSKTTAIDLIKGFDQVYYTDSLTAASFVTHYAVNDDDELKEIDLLPKIKHKVLVIPDLAPVLGGREDERNKTLGVLTRILDGSGYTSESGTHGSRGYDGDYRFGLVGATTPFTHNVWELMAKLGPRFLIVECEHEKPLSVDDLINSLDGTFRNNLKSLQSDMGNALDQLWRGYGGFGAVRWPEGIEDSRYKKILGDLTMWIVRCKGKVVVDKDQHGTWDVTESPTTETPYRLIASLWSMTRGHACRPSAKVGHLWTSN